jgi:[ribosomal protein S18]-alanine N-acetyltransferase
VYTIEPFRAQDLRDVATLAARVLPEPYPDAFFLHMAQGRRSHFRVSREAVTGELLGFVLAAREPGAVANLLLLAVHPAAQGQGLGRALLRDVQRALTLDQVRRVRLEVRLDNARAIDFYRREGFQVDGLEVGVYRDGGDALAMSKPLW